MGDGVICQAGESQVERFEIFQPGQGGDACVGDGGTCDREGFEVLKAGEFFDAQVGELIAVEVEACELWHFANGCER